MQSNKIKLLTTLNNTILNKINNLALNLHWLHDYYHSLYQYVLPDLTNKCHHH